MYRYFSTFENTIFHLIRASGVYFPASATQEILDEFRPRLCPFNSSNISNTVQYLELFLPCCVKPEEADIGYKLWFDEFMTLWDVCHNACAWENHMMGIMASIAQYQMGNIDWEPYIPNMFVRFQRTLQLPVTFKQRQLGKQHKIDTYAMAVWIVCALNSKSDTAFFHLEKLMQSLESYYHPANTGRWTPKLRELLRQLSYFFVQRIHAERYKTTSWDFYVPDHYKLSDESIDRFVTILKPCIEQAMFSRMGSQDTSLALQYLASVRPNIIIPMTLDKLYSSMYSLTEPHKLTSSMMGVIAVGRYMVQGSRNNFPEGPTHVIPLLTELLPGIDPNDIRKSYVTFNFIVHFVNMIPLINSSEAFNYHDLTEEEHTVCEATAETISESALGSVVGVVLHQCSPEIFKNALKMMFNFVINKVMEVQVSGKMLAVCCHCFAKVNPKETLKLFIPYLCDTIEQLLCENPNIEKEEHIDDELLYNLLILSEVVHGRSELINYMDRLMDILDKTLHMACVSASQLASRMLELVMSSLTSIQPTEVRSSPVEYSTPIKDFLSVREWGKPQDINDLKISWYVPQKTEVDMVQKLLNKFLVPELERVESVLEPWAFNLQVSGSNTVTMPDGRNVRKVIVDTLHRVQKKLLEDNEGDTQSIKYIINILSFTGKSFHMAKKLLEDRLHQKKLHLRHVLIDRVMLQQEFRIESRNCSFTETHKKILLDLFELSVSRYSEVRIAAQARLFGIISYFPYSYSVLTEKIKEILQLDSEKHHEKFKGCLYILLGPKSAPIVTRHDWEFIREMWPLIIKSMPSEKPSIISLMSSITDTIHKYFPTIAIKLIIPENVLKAAYNLNKNSPVCNLSQFQHVIDKGEEYLISKSDKKKQAYEGALNSLLDAVEKGNLHWRYNSMTLSFLRDLVHFDIKYNPRIVKFFLEASINESISIRKTAMRVLVFIMIQNKPKFKKIEIDPFKFSNVKLSQSESRPGIRDDNKWLLYNNKTLPKTSDEWEKLRFIHDQYTGYYTWPKKLEVYDSPSRQETAAKRMNNLNDSNVEKLIKYLSLEEKKGHDQFNAYRFLTFKNLFKIFEDKLLPIFTPHLKRLVQEKQESNQRCAAEIISAIIRGSKHWEYDKVENLWKILIPILETAISNICNETQTDWALCITMGIESRDPNRCHWLLEFLLDDPLKDPTSFVACSRLHLLSIAISQQSWRNSEIYNRLIEYLRPHLSHPFQNIREKISSCLTIIFCKDIIFPDGNKTDGPRIEQFFEEILPKFNILYNTNLAKSISGEHNNFNGISDNSNMVVFESEEEKEAVIRLFKIVAKFVTTNMVRVNFSGRPEFFDLLSLAALLQNSEIDEELSNIATNLLVVLAQTMTVEKYIPCAIDAIKKVAKCPSWSARAVIADFLPIFIFYNMATINAQKAWGLEIQRIVLDLLEDVQPEVRMSAAKVLSGLLHCQFILEPSELLNKLKLKAKTKLRHKTQNINQKENVSNGSIRFRHAGILGLCAFVNAHPYDVPDFLPDIFEQIRPHLNDPQPIPATIRKTLGDFKRTHHDNWEKHKLKFTEEELSLLSDLTVPPSYYV
ncbi:hypothetical protein NQ317_001354 [Molorchus minor]|uniref:Proteasome activator complex subunit 4 n=1 Tax=Molorchus minor TaxID=1323400 RepID=A0ABQ9JNY5_9CUCU|nr:hypothetical protein NQ317_001354 [Molorchus minor]